ncbi:MAG: 4'-phosphopantetheinyl transferase superfamily protein [Syntrophaceae bacterium]|nr:4'-phosphopantetheinyl transferase superfamily protein [Syntrophaceae bacterium]
MDLKQPDNLKASMDSRFPKKVLTVAEIEFVQNAQNPAQALWSFWACKETAYKVIKKIRPDASFLPRQWDVCLSPPARHYIDAIVLVSENQTIYSRLFLDDDYVHCVGSEVTEALDGVICEVIKLPAGNNGETENGHSFLRECASRKIAQHFHLNSSDLKIERQRAGGELSPPHVLKGDSRLAIDLSLSHDGRFGAYAFLP